MFPEGFNSGDAGLVDVCVDDKTLLSFEDWEAAGLDVDLLSGLTDDFDTEESVSMEVFEACV